jgi:hypothetical protein
VPASSSTLPRRPLPKWTTNRPTSGRHAHAAVDAWSSSKCSSAGGNRVDHQTRQQRTGRVRHDPAWPIHSYGLLTAEQANGTACASTHDEGVQHDEHVPTHLESLRNPTGKHLSGPARTDNGRGDRPTARGSNPENPIAQQVQTAGSCMKGFRAPDGTRNPPPFSPFNLHHGSPEAAVGDTCTALSSIVGGKRSRDMRVLPSKEDHGRPRLEVSLAV